MKNRYTPKYPFKYLSSDSSMSGISFSTFNSSQSCNSEVAYIPRVSNQFVRVNDYPSFLELLNPLSNLINEDSTNDPICYIIFVIKTNRNQLECDSVATRLLQDVKNDSRSNSDEDESKTWTLERLDSGIVSYYFCPLYQKICNDFMAQLIQRTETQSEQQSQQDMNQQTILDLLEGKEKDIYNHLQVYIATLP